MSPFPQRIVRFVAALFVLYPAVTHANGNYSHLWVATDALEYLEPGALRDLLTRPELRPMLRNGAMFPDGGYAVGDGYGELSHWEPFQTAYLEWIRGNFAPPWSDEAAQHIAFLMGMAAHGMTDQLYDGMYLTRHSHYDEPPASEPMFGVDGATDACFAATQGVMEPPAKWVPAAALAPLYEPVAGHVVSPQTLEQGQGLVVIAILAANDAVDHPEQLGEYMASYPWACANQDNAAVPGSPVSVGPAVARYYEVLWARLHGESAADKPLLGAFFPGGTPWDQPTDHTTPEGWVSFAMPFGLAPASINEETVQVVGPDGAPHPVSLNVYYGTDSHLVNVKPQEDWPVDAEFTVTISPPVTSWDGEELAQPLSFTFATFPEPAVVVEAEPAADVVEGTDAEVLQERDTVAEVAPYLSSEVRDDDAATAEPAVAEPVARSSSGCAVRTRAGAVPGGWWLVLLLATGLWGWRCAALISARYRGRDAGVRPARTIPG